MSLVTALTSFAAIMGLGGGELLLIMVVLGGLFTAVTALAIWAVTSLASRVRNNAQSVVAPVREQKKCPDCAEYVLAEARVCKHCSYRFEAKR